MAARRISPQTIAAIRAAIAGTTIEVLTPDFLRKDGALEIVVAAKPDVFNHNLETVPSKYLTVRPGARYFHSFGCCSGPRNSIRRCSPNRASWSGSARSGTKCCS